VKRLPILVALITVVVLADTVSAFDGKRRGFLLGGGVGASAVGYKETIEAPAPEGKSSRRETSFAAVTDFKIGGSTNESLLLYYHSWSSWFHVEGTSGIAATAISQVSGVGLRFYPEAESQFYVMGTVGVGLWSTPFEDNTKTQYGAGLLGGCGYEFLRHWSVEMCVGWSNPSSSDGPRTVKTNTYAFTATITGLAY